MKHKPKLVVLPEVLPTPQPAPSDGPRRRTHAHMQRLMAMAAASLLSSCHGGNRGYGVVDPMPSPPNCPTMADDLDVTAVWKQDGDKWLIVVSARWKSGVDGQFAAQQGQPEGVSRFELRADALRLSFDWTGADATYVASVDCTCTRGPTTVAFQISDPDQPADGKALAVQVHAESW